MTAKSQLYSPGNMNFMSFFGASPLVLATSIPTFQPSFALADTGVNVVV